MKSFSYRFYEDNLFPLRIRLRIICLDNWSFRHFINFTWYWIVSISICILRYQFSASSSINYLDVSVTSKWSFLAFFAILFSFFFIFHFLRRMNFLSMFFNQLGTFLSHFYFPLLILFLLSWAILHPSLLQPGWRRESSKELSVWSVNNISLKSLSYISVDEWEQK